jgi:hypothetical protein
VQKTSEEKSKTLLNHIGSAIQMHQGINVEISKHNNMLKMMTRKEDKSSAELIVLDSNLKKQIASIDSCYIWMIIIVEIFVLIIEFML